MCAFFSKHQMKLRLIRCWSFRNLNQIMDSLKYSAIQSVIKESRLKNIGIQAPQIKKNENLSIDLSNKKIWHIQFKRPTIALKSTMLIKRTPLTKYLYKSARSIIENLLNKRFSPYFFFCKIIVGCCIEFYWARRQNLWIKTRHRDRCFRRKRW